MEYSDIKKLIEDMGNSKLTSLDIEFPDGIKIKMEKKDEKIIEKVVSTENVNTVSTVSQNVVTNEVLNTNEIKVENVKSEEKEGRLIVSPMIGTFYAKPSPDSEPFVEVGKNVKKGDTVCIIEAMKLMNEIESEFDGKIVEILVSDGEMVDFGKPLFRIV